MSTVKIIEKQQDVSEIITEMSLLILLSLNDDDPLTINDNADPITNSESFKYKSSITGKTSNGNNGTEQGNTKTKKNLEIVVPWKYLSNFWRSLYMPLINCEVSLTLTWSENCVLTNITTQTCC